MIESEVKKKWCPMLGSKCVASDCAMWRWHQKSQQIIRPTGDAFVELPQEQWRGHCGLSGNDVLDYVTAKKEGF